MPGLTTLEAPFPFPSYQQIAHHGVPSAFAAAYLAIAAAEYASGKTIASDVAAVPNPSELSDQADYVEVLLTSHLGALSAQLFNFGGLELLADTAYELCTALASLFTRVVEAQGGTPEGEVEEVPEYVYHQLSEVLLDADEAVGNLVELVEDGGVLVATAAEWVFRVLAEDEPTARNGITSDLGIFVTDGAWPELLSWLAHATLQLGEYLAVDSSAVLEVASALGIGADMEDQWAAAVAEDLHQAGSTDTDEMVSSLLTDIFDKLGVGAPAEEHQVLHPSGVASTTGTLGQPSDLCTSAAHQEQRMSTHAGYNPSGDQLRSAVLCALTYQCRESIPDSAREAIDACLRGASIETQYRHAVSGGLITTLTGMAQMVAVAAYATGAHPGMLLTAILRLAPPQGPLSICATGALATQLSCAPEGTVHTYLASLVNELTSDQHRELVSIFADAVVDGVEIAAAAAGTDVDHVWDLL